jgi:hypothetical protein
VKNSEKKVNSLLRRNLSKSLFSQDLESESEKEEMESVLFEEDLESAVFEEDLESTIFEKKDPKSVSEDLEKKEKAKELFLFCVLNGKHKTAELFLHEGHVCTHLKLCTFNLFRSCLFFLKNPVLLSILATKILKKYAETFEEDSTKLNDSAK